MKTIGVRALRENPGMLSQCAAEGEYLLITNRNVPISLSVPFDDALIRSGAHINLAVRLYEDGLLTLVKAAKLSRLPVESFIEKLANMGVVVLDQSPCELEDDLSTIDG